LAEPRPGRNKPPSLDPISARPESVVAAGGQAPSGKAACVGVGDDGPGCRSGRADRVPAVGVRGLPRVRRIPPSSRSSSSIRTAWDSTTSRNRAFTASSSAMTLSSSSIDGCGGSDTNSRIPLPQHQINSGDQPQIRPDAPVPEISVPSRDRPAGRVDASAQSWPRAWMSASMPSRMRSSPKMNSVSGESCCSSTPADRTAFRAGNRC
jgi:hypothetical protein